MLRDKYILICLPRLIFLSVPSGRESTSSLKRNIFGHLPLCVSSPIEGRMYHLNNNTCAHMLQFYGFRLILQKILHLFSHLLNLCVMLQILSICNQIQSNIATPFSHYPWFRY